MMDLDSQRRTEPPGTGKQKTRTGQNSLTENTRGTSTCKCMSKIKRGRDSSLLSAYCVPGTELGFLHPLS